MNESILTRAGVGALGLVEGIGMSMAGLVVLLFYTATVMGVLGGVGMGIAADSPADAHVAVDEHADISMAELEARQRTPPEPLRSIEQGVERHIPVLAPSLDRKMEDAIRGGVKWLTESSLWIAFTVGNAVAAFAYTHQEIVSHPLILWPLQGVLMIATIGPYIGYAGWRLNRVGVFP